MTLRSLQERATALIGRTAQLRRATLKAQVAALPWRRDPGGEVQILLVTSRDSKRWIIPKGWPIYGKSLPEAAAQEAFEEAGVKGSIEVRELGRFEHLKRSAMNDAKQLTVHVFPMKVETELPDWPERDERTRRWYSLEGAAEKVSSRKLGALIISLPRHLQQSLISPGD